MKSFIVLLLVSFSFFAKGQIVVKATFAGKNGGNISKKEFLQKKNLMVSVIQKDSSWANDESWRVNSYKLIVGGKEFNGKDNVIPAEAASAIQQAAPGTKITFDNIMSNRGNMARGLPPLTFTVVE